MPHNLFGLILEIVDMLNNDPASLWTIIIGTNNDNNNVFTIPIQKYGHFFLQALNILRRRKQCVRIDTGAKSVKQWAPCLSLHMHENGVIIDPCSHLVEVRLHVFVHIVP